MYEGIAEMGVLFVCCVTVMITLPLIIRKRRRQLNPPPSKEELLEKELGDVNKYIASLQKED